MGGISILGMCKAVWQLYVYVCVCVYIYKGEKKKSSYSPTEKATLMEKGRKGV